MRRTVPHHFHQEYIRRNDTLWPCLEITPNAFSKSGSGYPDEDLHENINCLRFDRATEESVYFWFRIPCGYKKGGGIAVLGDWMVENPPSGTGDEYIIAALEYKRFASGDVFDTSSGTSTVSGTLTTVDGEAANIIRSSGFIDLTPASTWEENNWLWLRFYRDATNAGDTYDNEAVGADNDLWVPQITVAWEERHEGGQRSC